MSYVEELYFFTFQCYLSGLLGTIQNNSDTLIELEVENFAVPHRLTNEMVDVRIIKSKFTCNAWKLLKRSVKKLKMNKEYPCDDACGDDLSNHRYAICCDSCLAWQNYHCANVKSALKSKVWFCVECETC